MQSFTVKRGYRVPAQVTLLDWGGTTANFGCMAPASVFVETGNDLGLSLENLEAFDPQQRQQRREAAARRLAQAGMNYVVDSVRNLMPCVKEIEDRLTRGESP